VVIMHTAMFNTESRKFVETSCLGVASNSRSKGSVISLHNIQCLWVRATFHYCGS